MALLGRPSRTPSVAPSVAPQKLPARQSNSARAANDICHPLDTPRVERLVTSAQNIADIRREVATMANRVRHDSRRGLRTPLLGVMAITCVVSAWHAAEWGRNTGERSSPVRRTQAPTSEAWMSDSLSSSPVVVYVPSGAPQPGKRPENTVCGWSDAAAANDTPSVHQSPPSALLVRTLDALDTRMLSNPDPAVQAAALLIGARTRPDQSRQRVEQLVRLATASRDVRIYAIAEEGCKDADADESSACRLLEPAQWAQLDSDNAVPWLMLAEASRTRGDVATEDDAMYHAARSQHSDPRSALVPELVEQALADAPQHSLIRRLGLATGWQVQADWSWSATVQAMHYCMADDRVLTDDDRMKTCDLLARRLAEVQGNPVDTATAQAIGTRLRWPADRLEALASQTALAGDVARRRNVGMDSSCRGVDAAQASMQRQYRR